MSPTIKKAMRLVKPILYPLLLAFHRLAITPANIIRNKNKKERWIEIGPGPNRLPGFETLNVEAAFHVDYVCNASRGLPFPDETFDLMYASHVLEHVPWYQTEQTLRSWVRTIKQGGSIEIWVPDGLRIAREFVNAEAGQQNEIHMDGWYRFNPDRDPCVWANGRIFSYGDGTGSKQSSNWHLALFSARHLQLLMQRVGLVDIERLDRSSVRGHDHGWINLGFRGRKP